MRPEDIDTEYIKGAKLFHITGITPALSDACCGASYKAIEIAKSNNIIISLDTNIRLKLWNEERAREVLLPMIKKATILLTEPDDTKILIGERNTEKLSKPF